MNVFSLLDSYIDLLLANGVKDYDKVQTICCDKEMYDEIMDFFNKIKGYDEIRESCFPTEDNPKIKYANFNFLLKIS